MTNHPPPASLPLTGIRIVDALEGGLAPLTRYLADLGARVEGVVPVNTNCARDVAANVGKVWLAQDGALANLEVCAAGARAVVSGPADIVTLAQLRRDQPSLVTMVVSDFGHPWLTEVVLAERHVGATRDIAEPPRRPAPLAGEQTEEVMADWLGLTASERRRLIAAGVLVPVEPAILAAAREYVGAAAAAKDQM